MSGMNNQNEDHSVKPIIEYDEDDENEILVLEQMDDSEESDDIAHAKIEQ